MQSDEIRKRFLNYCQRNGHTIVPAVPLIPENDPTTLFTGSGMQPMLPYLLGEPYPAGHTRVADSQPCFRSGDIEEVGDNRHATLFEMLGSWSFGDYFKEEQITWIADFLFDKKEGLGLDINKFYVTTFIGDEKNDLPRDDEAVNLWKTKFAEHNIVAESVDMGTADEAAQLGMRGGRIFAYDAKENWWSRAGIPDNMPIGEPGGPDSEMFYDFGGGHDTSFGENCHPACDCGRFVEIGNNVFMTYKKVDEGVFEELPAKNIDFGGGFERLVTAIQGKDYPYQTDLFDYFIKFLEDKSQDSYAKKQLDYHIIADHIRAAIFMISDGARPGNKDQGYILRRLLRRAVGRMRNIGFDQSQLGVGLELIISKYEDAYPNLREHDTVIVSEIIGEIEKFAGTLEQGLKEFQKIVDTNNSRDNIAVQEFGQHNTVNEVNLISAEEAFRLFTTFGFPIDLIREEAEKIDLHVDEVGFSVLLQEHQDMSRTASAGKFKGGLAGDSPKIRALHTATHLMLSGLREYVGDHVTQAGSNTTEERIRFDFTNDSKVDRETLDKIEIFVNNAIAAGADVTIEEMEKETARQSGVVGAFWEKYPDVVKVYSMTGSDGTIYSRELCGGPHAENTGDLSQFGEFKIKKEESSSAGVRRIKATLV